MELLEKIELYKKQEEECVFDSFDNETAWEIGCIIVNRAKKENLKLLVDIVLNDQILFRYAQPRTTPSNARMVARKQNVVKHAQMCSLRYGTQLQIEGKTLEDVKLDPEQYAAVGGGFPITVKGEGIVGAIGVSGLIAADDHQVMVDAIKEYLSK
ncbi:MAG: heme-degrading domain-containing protein [Clostridia bacterium]